MGLPVEPVASRGVALTKGLKVKEKLFGIILLSVIAACSFVQNVAAQPYSGSGRNPPKQLSERQLSVLKEVVPLIPSSENKIELIALMMVESNLTPTAVSRTGDFGVTQVNCRIWRKRLKTELGIQDCEKELMKIDVAITAGVYVLNRFKRFRRCRGSNVYACYNGGQNWKTRAEACQAACQDDTCKRKCWRPSRYANSVRKHIRFLKRKYSDYIK